MIILWYGKTGISAYTAGLQFSPEDFSQAEYCVMYVHVCVCVCVCA